MWWPHITKIKYHGHSQSNFSNEGPLPSPRQAFLKDLGAFIDILQGKGHSILLCLDGNETPSECRGPYGQLRAGSLDHFLNDFGLEEVFKTSWDLDVDRSTTTPQQFIDRVAVWNVNIC